MALTIDEIYDRNQYLNSIVVIEVKRKNTSGSYESSWTNIETLVNHPVVTHDVIGSIKYKIPKESYSFGAVEVPECHLKFNSIWGEFQKEDDSRSIFYGFIRHMSLIRILYGYQDSRTGDIALEEEYRGFINDEAAATKVDSNNIIQGLQIDDLLTTLIKKYTFADISPTKTTLNEVVYEVFNRSEFTDFMTVSTGNINAGYNIPLISYTDSSSNPTWYGNEQILTFIQGLSTGHSFFYQRAGVFYYQPLAPGLTVAKTFDDNKVVKYMNYERGVDKVFEILYWKDSNTKWQATTVKYNRTKTFNIKGINSTASRQAILSAIGVKISKEYDGFIVEVPLYPKIHILDRIQVIAGGYNPPDAFILDKSRLDIDYLREYLGANQSDDSQYWMVKEVEHNHQRMITKMTVQSF